MPAPASCGPAAIRRAPGGSCDWGWGWKMALEMGAGHSPVLTVHREPGSSPAVCLQVF